MSETISLEATPIVETTVEQIEKNLETDGFFPKMSDLQAQERVKRLSEEVRFLVDANRKLETQCKKLSNDRSDLTEQLLAAQRALKGWEDLNDFVDTPETLESLIPISAASEQTLGDSSWLQDYFFQSQAFSNFRSDNPKWILGTSDHFMNAAVGLAEECAEIVEASVRGFSAAKDLDKIKKEIGDTFWYIAMMCDALGLAFSEIVSREMHPDSTSGDAINNACAISLSVLGHAKKVHFHGHEIDKTLVAGSLGQIVYSLYDTINAIGSNLPDILEANITKLQARYSEGKFSSEASINRASEL